MWVISVAVLALVGYQIYLGLVLRKVGIPGIFEVEFADAPLISSASPTRTPTPIVVPTVPPNTPPQSTTRITAIQVIAYSKDGKHSAIRLAAEIEGPLGEKLGEHTIFGGYTLGNFEHAVGYIPLRRSIPVQECSSIIVKVSVSALPDKPWFAYIYTVAVLGDAETRVSLEPVSLDPMRFDPSGHLRLTQTERIFPDCTRLFMDPLPLLTPLPRRYR